MKFANWVAKSIGWLLTHALQGIITVIVSFTAIASFYIFDSIPMKILGFIASLIIGYAATYYLGKLRGEDKR